jgi:Zn finger protein HypA/HybF involved in hydrogenase expression
MTNVIFGVNDLATTHPDLAKEADGWDPTKVFSGTNKKMPWKCFRGHRWVTVLANRSKKNHGCPYCGNQKLLVGFNDLATTHPDLAKETDGWDPTTQFAGSRKKMKWICDQGHRFTAAGYHRVTGRNCPVCSNHKIQIGFNDLATTHPDLAKEADGWDPTTQVAGTGNKLKWKCDQGHKWVATGDTRVRGGNNCPYCGNQKFLVGVNDLATTHPDLAKEADGWDPKTQFAGTGNKLKWKCNQGHNWVATGSSRVNSNSGCPVCSNLKIQIGFNDLATTHPDLAKEADGWDPTTQVAGTGNKLKWKCDQGHKWVARVAHRTTSESGCPTCSITGFDPNQNGYVYFLIHPKWEIYQIGITNVPENRLGRHKRNGFDLLELRGPMDGQTAREIESSLLRYLKSQKADLSPDHVAGKFDGYSESWTIDSYKVNSLKELIDKASEAGF